jgi:hypothetical protein
LLLGDIPLAKVTVASSGLGSVAASVDARCTGEGDENASVLSDNLFDSDGGIRNPRFDLPVFAVGAIASAVLSVGLATGLLYLSRTSTGPSVGPTAATLNDAFSTLLGAVLGLLLGSGLTACFARRGSRMVTGLLAGFFAYAAVLIPVVILTGPNDVSAGESFGLALALGVPLGLAILIGSMIGAGLGASHRMTFGKR